MVIKKKLGKGKDIDISIRVNKEIEKAIKEGMKKHGKDKWKSNCCSSGGCGYFLGFLGAAVYYISTANGFWNGVLGFLKALVWPAFLVYEALKFFVA
ncbi:MAG: hypothetical protein ACE5ES_01395 [Candidatus Nanoarchaeia archaeon]